MLTHLELSYFADVVYIFKICIKRMAPINFPMLLLSPFDFPVAQPAIWSDDSLQMPLPSYLNVKGKKG